MNVIAGKKRGLKLLTIEGLKTRPTASRLKEALFNTIQFDLCEKSFCDLFSGSGQIGIEALSRGAKNAVFVDNNKECIDVINKNLIKAGFLEDSKILNLDYEKAIVFLSERRYKFDIIFMDAPYNTIDYKNALSLIKKYCLLDEKGVIIIEESSDYKFENIEGFLITKQKAYKTTTFSYLEEIN